VDELIQQAGLPHTVLPHQRDHLATAAPGQLQGLAEVIQFTIPRDEAGEPSEGSCSQP
jgi:hypothetical protein